MASEAGRRVVVLHWLENALLAVAIVAIGWYASVRASAIIQQARDSRALDRQVAHRAVAVKSTNVADTPPPPDTVIGRIHVPRLGLTAIVREGTGAFTLDRAVGHLPETALPGRLGNAALAGHRDTFFRSLRGIEPGDHVIMTMPDRTVTYEVRDARIVGPRDVSVLDPTPEPTLTLITCHPFTYIGDAPDRFVVRAVADRADVLAAPTRLPSRPLATATRLIPPPVGTSVLRGARAESSGVRTPRKNKAGATTKSKKVRVEPKKKRGFWGTLGRIFR